MIKHNKTVVFLPKLKHSSTQGEIGYHLLKLIDKSPFRPISKVRDEFKPLVLENKKKREMHDQDKLERLLKNIEKDSEKVFDGEYCRLKDYLVAFNFIIMIGPKNDEQVTLTFFGKYLLEECKKNHVENIFDKSNNDFIARVYLFVDSNSNWKILSEIKQKSPITIIDLAYSLDTKGVKFDLEKIEKDILRKKEYIDWLKIKTNEAFGNKTNFIPYSWRKERELEYIHQQSTVSARTQIYFSSLIDTFMSVGLIRYENDKIFANANYFEILKSKHFWLTSDEISPENFFIKMFDIYKEMIRNNKLTSVPIHLLRKNVCDELGLLWQSFDKILRMNPRGYNGFQVNLTRASSAKILDLEINTRHFYYLQMKQI